MQEDLMKASLIDKELIAELQFKENIIVKQHPDLLKQIESATTLGNAFHGKVVILFHDDEGLKKVETTIWAAGTKFISLKGGVWIPISRIVEIKF